MMKKVEKLLVTTVTIFSGMLLSSLWITHSDSWKIYLPIILVCISLKMALDD